MTLPHWRAVLSIPLVVGAFALGGTPAAGLAALLGVVLVAQSLRAPHLVRIPVTAVEPPVAPVLRTEVRGGETAAEWLETELPAF